MPNIPYNAPAGISRSETDKSQLPSNRDTFIGFRGAVSGLFMGGQPNRRVLVKSPSEFEQKFGRASAIPSAFKLDWYAVYNAVASTDGIYVHGIIPSTDASSFKYANAKIIADGIDADSLPDVTNVGIPANSTITALASYPTGYADDEFPEVDTAFVASTKILLASRFIGTFGNSIKVTITKLSAQEIQNFTSSTTDDLAISLVKVVVSVLNGSGLYEVKENWVCTLIDTTDFYGNTIFIEDVINTKSAYIYARCDMTGVALPSNVYVGEFILGGGALPTASSLDADVASARKEALKSFANGEDVRLHAICVPEYSSTNAVMSDVTNAFYAKLHAIVIGQASPSTETTYSLAQAVTYRNSIGISPSAGSFASTAYGWGVHRDPFTKKKINLPNSIELFKAQFEVAKGFGIHEAPANENVSFSRSEKQFPKLTKEQVGEIYALCLNPFYSVNGQTRIYGQKTMQLLETARQRVNVRHILNGVGFGVADQITPFVFRVGSESNAERIDDAVRDILEAYKGREWFNTLTGGKGFEYSIDFSELISNKVYIKVRVNPARTMEWFGIDVEVTNDNIKITQA